LTAQVTPFPSHAAQAAQVGFERDELQRILNLYGRMVSAGEWRDYAMDFGKDAAVFCGFRRAAEHPKACGRSTARPGKYSSAGMNWQACCSRSSGGCCGWLWGSGWADRRASTILPTLRFGAEPILSC
jgi:hypothetical protein